MASEDTENIINNDLSSASMDDQQVRTDRAQLNSVFDVANVFGHFAEETANIYSQAELDQHIRDAQRRVQWENNYQEAAIFLQEGQDNDKFNTHPKNQNALPAYFIAHNKIFYAMDFIAAVMLLCLALFEKPAVFTVPVAVHSSLEIFGLLIVSIELVLKLRWLGFRTFVKHVRTMIKVSVLIIMLVEALVVLARQTNHFRVTRALRPIFLLDSYFCRGVRRFVRQLIQSLLPILDMLVLLLFFMLIFSILGFYIFSRVPGDTYFSTIQDSFVSLFVLVTTANYPDVMMPAYANNKASAIFFVVYLSVELYFLMNLLLAVVYDIFTRTEKNKLKKLFLHQRLACRHAFRLLVSKQNQNEITLKHFMGLMKYYRAAKSRRDVYLVFKSINKSNSGLLTLEEFYQIYEVCGLNWSPKKTNEVWSSHFYFPFNRVFYAIYWLVTRKAFDVLIYIIIGINFACHLWETVEISDFPEITMADYTFTWYAILFLCLYSLEAVLKILGLGPWKYFTSGWNIFDFLVTALAVIGMIVAKTDQGFYFIITLRPFRLLRIFKLKQRFRDVLGTFFILMSRMVSLAVSIILIYYFFGIIGIELFSGYDMKNCCVNTSVEMYYEYTNASQGYYYLNNFASVLDSGVTLFELTVVNNWFIIMEGYAAVATGWSRIFFMLFYIVMMVVMTVIVAFILEAFMFRMEYMRQMKLGDMDDHSHVKIEVPLCSEEVMMCHNKNMILHTSLIKEPPATTADDQNQDGLTYRGSRMRSKFDFSIKMYGDEVKEWCEEFNLACQQQQEEETENEMQEIVNVPNSMIDTPVYDRSLIHSCPATDILLFDGLGEGGRSSQ
ncbi:two pore calcium channel protein 1-like [Lineus longissimus]|uniref:two pore calcium channel protein 1-like n=1 Tax=Lineus longissimus TaxID=88925 RepID=UPI002B4D36F4